MFEGLHEHLSDICDAILYPNYMDADDRRTLRALKSEMRSTLQHVALVLDLEHG